MFISVNRNCLSGCSRSVTFVITDVVLLNRYKQRVHVFLNQPTDFFFSLQGLSCLRPPWSVLANRFGQWSPQFFRWKQLLPSAAGACSLLHAQVTLVAQCHLLQPAGEVPAWAHLLPEMLLMLMFFCSEPKRLCLLPWL